MQHLLKLTLILQLYVTPWAASVSQESQPYCYKNITETTYITVTKTRIKNVSSKNIFKKITFKKDTQVEVYEELEPVYKIKLERNCCEGYKMTKLDLCEPQCVENSCPKHSKCVEPEVCECVKGYFPTRSQHDGKHHCQPICEEPCPEHSQCVGPNNCGCDEGYFMSIGLKCRLNCTSGCPHGGTCVGLDMCSCQPGYKSAEGTCIPICTLGDQCQNGKCLAKDTCICNPGFSWNKEVFKCEQNDMEAATTPDTINSNLEETTYLIVAQETDIRTSDDYVEPNQGFDETMETTTDYAIDEYGTHAFSSLGENHKCPQHYVFHNGQCRLLRFVSDNIDCWLRPCQDKNARCLENGTCACNEGFNFFGRHVVDQDSLIQTVEFECLSDAEYEIKLQNLEAEHNGSSIQEPTNWLLIFFTILGVLIIVSALVLLALKLMLKQTGEIDVEGKNLACTYDNRACSDMEKTVF